MLSFTVYVIIISSVACACGTCPIALIWLPHASDIYLRILLVSPASFVESGQD